MLVVRFWLTEVLGWLAARNLPRQTSWTECGDSEPKIDEETQKLERRGDWRKGSGGSYEMRYYQRPVTETWYGEVLTGQKRIRDEMLPRTSYRNMRWRGTDKRERGSIRDEMLSRTSDRDMRWRDGVLWKKRDEMLPRTSYRDMRWRDTGQREREHTRWGVTKDQLQRHEMER